MGRSLRENVEMTVGHLDEMIDANRAMCVGREKTVGFTVTVEVVGFNHWRAQRRRRQRKRLGNVRSVGAVRMLLSGGISALAHSGPEWNRKRSERLRHDEVRLRIHLFRGAHVEYQLRAEGLLRRGGGAQRDQREAAAENGREPIKLNF